MESVSYPSCLERAHCTSEVKPSWSGFRVVEGAVWWKIPRQWVSLRLTMAGHILGQVGPRVLKVPRSDFKWLFGKLEKGCAHFRKMWWGSFEGVAPLAKVAAPASVITCPSVRKFSSHGFFRISRPTCTRFFFPGWVGGSSLIHVFDGLCDFGWPFFCGSTFDFSITPKCQIVKMNHSQTNPSRVLLPIPKCNSQTAWPRQPSPPRILPLYPDVHFWPRFPKEVQHPQV